MLWLAAAAAAEQQATVDAHGDVSDAFDAALQLNAAEHEAQMEVACSHFSCSVAADYDVPPMSRWSMGPVQILNDYSETLQGEDQIFVSEEPLFSPAECEEVIRLTELEGEGLPSSQSGKYKLGKAWIKDMPQVKDWFNEALRTKVPSSSPVPPRPAPAPLPPHSCGAPPCISAPLCTYRAAVVPHARAPLPDAGLQRLDATCTLGGRAEVQRLAPAHGHPRGRRAACLHRGALAPELFHGRRHVLRAHRPRAADAAGYTPPSRTLAGAPAPSLTSLTLALRT